MAGIVVAMPAILGLCGWTISNNCVSADTYTMLTNDPVPALQLENTAFKITGDPAKYKNIKQDVVVKGSEGDSFVLAGWAKGHSAPLSGERKFAIRARFNYTDGTTSEYFDAQFNTSVDQWQYSAVAMVAKQAYSSITVAAVYDYVLRKNRPLCSATGFHLHG